MNVLGIETSCDDTSVAVVRSDCHVLGCLVADQNKVHAPFGGVVPEIASRNHSYHLLPLIDQAIENSNLSWHDIHGIAVTNRPGLVGSLIVGLVTAKTLALAKKIPFIGVHHIEGHISAPFLKDQYFVGADFYNEDFLALIVSGGHTSLYHVSGWGNYQLLGQTKDDAAGEAFDKFAKMLGLAYPGGIEIDKLSQSGDPKKFSFPRPLLKSGNFDFSFSGLKAAGQRTIESMGNDQVEANRADLCASYQAAIVDVLVEKAKTAMVSHKLSKIVVSGGVSANSLLRSSFAELCKARGYELAIPPLRYCTDNAAMIGLAGLWRLEQNEFSSQDLAPKARDPL